MFVVTGYLITFRKRYINHRIGRDEGCFRTYPFNGLFSDPFEAFQDEESQKILLRISSTPTSQLQVNDYIIIFQEICPPGTVSETLLYISPVFKFIKRKLFRANLSTMLNIWENFASWMHDNINEIEKLRYKSTIDYEINNLFLYLSKYGCGLTINYYIVLHTVSLP